MITGRVIALTSGVAEQASGQPRCQLTYSTRVTLQRHSHCHETRQHHGCKGQLIGKNRTSEGIGKSALMMRPNIICSARAPFISSSPFRAKGKLPSSSTYSMTPQDQMSATLPSYSSVVRTCKFVTGRSLVKCHRHMPQLEWQTAQPDHDRMHMQLRERLRNTCPHLIGAVLRMQHA